MSPDKSSTPASSSSALPLPPSPAENQQSVKSLNSTKTDTVNGTALKTETIAQVRQLMQQPLTNPMQFSGAFERTKSDYIARQYHITPNTMDQ